MKFFSIDEDTMNALMELISDAYVEACNIQDNGSVQFYAYLLGELENAKYVGDSTPLSKDEEIRMKKIERYLRMLQKGLQDPKNKKENEKRRKFARDIINPKQDKKEKEEVIEIKEIRPYFSDNMPLDRIESILQGMTNLSNYEKYEIYQAERDKREEGYSLDEMCKDIGIKRPRKNKS